MIGSVSPFVFLDIITQKRETQFSRFPMRSDANRPCSTTLEFRESDVLSGKTEVKLGKFVEFLSPQQRVILEKHMNHKT